MDERQPVIVSAVRTAIGTFGGALKDVPAVELGRTVIREVLVRAGVRPDVPGDAREIRPSVARDVDRSEIEAKYMDWDQSLRPVYIDEVIMGNVLQGAQGQNPGRQASIRAGVPQETNVFTINKVCASGIKAVALAAQAIRAGDAEAIVAGGMESMSKVAYALPKARWGYRMDISGKAEALDMMVYDGLWEILYGYHMGVTAENIARDYDISRREQDELGAESHRRAMKAIKGGHIQGGDRARAHRPEEGPAADVRDGRKADGDGCGEDGQAGAGVRQGRYGDRRECLGDQRWSGRSAGHFPGLRGEAWTEDQGHRQGLRLRRRGPQVHGARPHTGDTQAAEEA